MSLFDEGCSFIFSLFDMALISGIKGDGAHLIEALRYIIFDLI